MYTYFKYSSFSLEKNITFVTVVTKQYLKMKALRVLSDFCVLASNTVLLIIIGNYSFTQISQQSIIDILLHIMHISLLVAVVVNTIHQVKKRHWARMIVTLLIGLCLVGAFVMSFYNIHVDGVGLLVYDFILIYYFFYLLIDEFRPKYRRVSTYY